MSDRLHDHLSIGPRAGCEACAQVDLDLATGRRAVYARAVATE